MKRILENSKNKKLLRESFSRDWNEALNINKLKINESIDSKIVTEGKEHTVYSKYEVPVWRLGKRNLNGRTYKESLGKRVESVYRDLVTANLADHPEGDAGGSVANILSVAKNPHVREGILWVDAYIVDEDFEKKLEKMNNIGYGLGVSSSVYGDIDNDGVVIDESVEMVRYFDWVLEPSYSVFVTKENRVSESTKSTKKELDENINKGENTLENKEEAIEMAFKLNIKNLVKEAELKTKISDKVQAFEDIASCLNDSYPELQEQINARLTELRKESLELAERASGLDQLSKDVALKESEKEQIKESFNKLTEDNKVLAEKYEKSCKLIDDLNENYHKSVDVINVQTAEINSRFTAKEYESVLKFVEHYANTVKSLKEKLASIKNSLDESNKAVKDLKEKNESLNKKLLEKPAVVEKTHKDISDTISEDYSHTQEINQYFNNLVESDPRYMPYKESIIGCKTVLEAQCKALKLKSVVENTESEKFYERNSFRDTHYLNESEKSNGTGYDYTQGGPLNKKKGWI